MIGLVVITHGRLAGSLLETAEMIVGPTVKTFAVGISRGEDIELLRQRLAEVLGEAGSDGDGCLVMTDLFGGTPANLCAPHIRPLGLEVLTGVNLPMLIKAISLRPGADLPDLAQTLKTYGQQSIHVVSDLLKRS